MVIVTGASGAIGQQICRQFAADGHNVCLLANAHIQQAQQTAQECSRQYGVRCVTAKADLANPDEIDAAIDYAYQALGHPDCLVNNAAIAPIVPVSCMSVAQWQQVLAVNLTAAFCTCKRVLATMYHTGGSIVNVSSMWAQLGASCEVAYSASKAALEGMTRALADEYEGRVRINALALGFVDTPMNAHMSEAEKADFFAANPTMRCLTPQQAAKAVWQLSKEECSGTVVRLGW